MATLTFEDLWPEVCKHQRPRVTDRKGNPTWRTSPEEARTMPYVEPNITGILVSQIIVDRDLPDADRIAERLGLLPPSSVSINAFTTTGHIRYGLKDSVPLTDAARRPPVNFLARIEHGLVTILEGDPGYTGTLTKNPLHPQHQTLWGPYEALYGLRELAANLDELGALPEARNPRKNVSRSAVGRNVALFDDTRQWAYKAIERFWGAPASEWSSAVLHQAHTYNETRIACDFSTGALPLEEVRHLAKSVAGWVWGKFTPERRAQIIANTHTSELQAERGRKGGAARVAQMREARAQRLRLLEMN